jgi:hypothetical protein
VLPEIQQKRPLGIVKADIPRPQKSVPPGLHDTKTPFSYQAKLHIFARKSADVVCSPRVCGSRARCLTELRHPKRIYRNIGSKICIEGLATYGNVSPANDLAPELEALSLGNI